MTLATVLALAGMALALVALLALVGHLATAAAALERLSHDVDRIERATTAVQIERARAIRQFADDPGPRTTPRPAADPTDPRGDRRPGGHR